MKTYESADPYHYSSRVSDLDTTTRWVDIWAPQKLTILQKDSTTGLACLTGYVHLLLIV